MDGGGDIQLHLDVHTEILKLNITDVILSSSDAKKLVFF